VMDFQNPQTILSLRYLALRKGYFTGSRRLGGCHDGSDWDYIVEHKDVMDICETFGDVPVDLRATFATYAIAFMSFRFGELNLIIVNGPEDVLAWKYATETTAAFGPLEKPRRIVVFGDALNRAYRTMGKKSYWKSL